MKYFILASILVLTLTACRNGNKASDTARSFDERLDSLFAEAPDFSGIALIADDAKTKYHKAWGYKQFATREPLDTNSIFELASVSKQFTAMIVMLLQEEGKLKYDDTLGMYVPGLPYRKVTIRQLLNHTSGLPDYQAVMDQFWDKSRIAGNAENIDYLIRYHPAKHFPPGDKYEYSNTGYMLLATIAEKASGKDFVALCRDKIFNRLGMSSTDIRTREEKMKLTNIAWGHIHDPATASYVPADSFPEFNYTIWLGNRVGPGRMSSTARDLLMWDRALRSDRMAQHHSLMEAYSPARLNNDSLSYYGFGWRIERHPILGKVVRHSGDNPGYKTHIARYLDSGATIILLCNNQHEKFGQLLSGIEDLLAKERG